MKDFESITPIRSFQAQVRPPGSKSLTNRALLLAALARGPSVVNQPLVAQDTQVMVQALQSLGFEIDVDQTQSLIRVVGGGGKIPRPNQGRARLHLGNAGTAYRFLTSACALGSCGAEQNVVYELDGIARMRQRPIGQLVDALRRIDGKIDYLDQDGYPPLAVRGGGLEGGRLELATTLSSQYVSSLLQVGPYCRQGLTIQFQGPVTSRPYVQMTVGLMRHFGATVDVQPGFGAIHVEGGGYVGVDYDVEPDASAASYFLAAAAVVPGSQCTIQGLGRRSLQGDVGFADVLHSMGAGLVFGPDFITVMSPPDGQRLRGIDIDLNKMPDMAQTLAVVALLADGPTAIRNVGNLRVKETDRLEALRCELTKFHAGVRIDGDDLLIHPPPDLTALSPEETLVDTYDDHRMAMSFAVLGLRVPGVVIADPSCVAKTFPDYFDYLGRLGHS